MARSDQHLEVTGVPDRVSMMQMLSSMQPDVLERVMERAQAMRTKSDPTTQEGIHENWMRLKDGEAELQKQKQQGMHSITTTQSWDVKKALPTSSIDPSKYNPIQITDMGLGTTHRGRIVIARVADGGGIWSIASGALLIEDLCGSVMEVAVYNYPQGSFARDFPPGREICIIEPYYKIRSDGSVGIRVDNPDEICDYPLPKTQEGWKDLGNFSIKHCPFTALACYEYGLHTPNKEILEHLSNSKTSHKSQKAQDLDQEGKDLMLQASKLLTNLSICEFNLSNFDTSLLYALLAWGLGLDRYKSAWWIAKSLHSSNPEAAYHFAAWYCRCYRDVDSSSLRAEFNLSDSDINSLEAGSSFIHSNTPSELAKASQSINLSKYRSDDWLSAKHRGNDYFKESKTLEARDCYVAALAVCPFLDSMFQGASFLISNKGAAWLNIENSPIDSIDGAISMLCAALLHSYGNGRAWLRAARFLELQGRNDDATLLLRDCIIVIKEHKVKLPFLNEQTSPKKTLMMLKSELIKRERNALSKSQVKSINPESTEKQLKERGVKYIKSGRSLEALEEEIMTCEKIYDMNKMMVMFGQGDLIKRMAGPTMDNQLHGYFRDFMQTVGVPDGLDKSYVGKILYWSHVKYRNDPWVRAMGWRMAWSKEGSNSELGKLLTDGDDIFKRWHGSYPIKVIQDNPAK